MKINMILQLRKHVVWNIYHVAYETFASDLKEKIWRIEDYNCCLGLQKFMFLFVCKMILSSKYAYIAENAYSCSTLTNPIHFCSINTMLFAQQPYLTNLHVKKIGKCILAVNSSFVVLQWLNWTSNI